MGDNIENFIQQNSPDGALKHTLQGKDFLQSEEWRKFQEAVGRKTYNISSEEFCANIIEHSLPLVGKYFYVPRGPIINNQGTRNNDQWTRLINLAKENRAGWIRIEPNDEEALKLIKNDVKNKIVKAPHDMQPKEIFLVDIAKPEDQLLAEMKPKTRYNIKLAQKRGVSVRAISNFKIPMCQSKADPPMAENKVQNPNDQSSKYISEFLRLVKITAERDRITPHPENYYRKMLEVIPDDILKLYVAEYEGKVIAANLVVFYPHTKTTKKGYVGEENISSQKDGNFGVGVYGNVCTYLHGASDNEYRNVMAPYLLQWQQIKDAKAAGCKKYDFGGIRTKTGEGITRFKLGFSSGTQATGFPGCYDIIIDNKRYWLYRAIQRVKSIL